ncbi:Tetratricopeptide repeat-containing protein [Desulfonema limicola]|uniref:Tetratricopeptide repeat-containing protein n=2 Tax=Desulfonema limicola TaxID=45656 RepID=A0A975BB18_9BACT|nr:Tetratricopeptide repeat-containing protein [Desulfonema limicola]
MFVMLISFMLLLTAGSVTGTYIRNMDWASEKTLWEDAMNKAPGRVRPLANLATEHYKKIGDYDKALELYNKALTLKSHKQDFEKRISILNNTASIWHSKGEYGKAAVIYKQILSEVPGHINAHYNIILSLMAGGKWNEALHYADVLVSRQYIKPQYWNIRGLILLNQEKPDQAFSDFEKALEIKPGYWEALFNTAVSLSMQKKYNQADTLLNRTNKIRPENILNLLYLIENSLKMNDKKLTLQYIEKLFASFSIIEIKAVMNRLPGNDLYIPFSNKLLMPAVQQRLEKES